MLETIEKQKFFLDSLLYLSKIDKNFSEIEKNIIIQLSKNFFLLDYDISKSIELNDILNATINLSVDESFHIIKELFNISITDFILSKDEEKYIKSLCDKFNLLDKDFDKIKKWALSMMKINSELDHYISKRNFKN